MTEAVSIIVAIVWYCFFKVPAAFPAIGSLGFLVYAAIAIVRWLLGGFPPRKCPPE